MSGADHMSASCLVFRLASRAASRSSRVSLFLSSVMILYGLWLVVFGLARAASGGASESGVGCVSLCFEFYIESSEADISLINTTEQSSWAPTSHVLVVNCEATKATISATIKAIPVHRYPLSPFEL